MRTEKDDGAEQEAKGGGYQVGRRWVEAQPAELGEWLGATVDAVGVLEAARVAACFGPLPVYGFLTRAADRLNDEIDHWIKVSPEERAAFERELCERAQAGAVCASCGEQHGDGPAFHDADPVWPFTMADLPHVARLGSVSGAARWSVRCLECGEACRVISDDEGGPTPRVCPFCGGALPAPGLGA